MHDLRDMQLIGDDLQQFQQNIQLLRKMSDQFCEQPTPAGEVESGPPDEGPTGAPASA